VPRRRIRLDSVAAIMTELAYVYRRAERGAMDWQDARHAAWILRELRSCIEGNVFEQRIAELQARVDAADAERRRGPNGGTWSSGMRQ
jgi:hypothetical protein